MLVPYCLYFTEKKAWYKFYSVEGKKQLNLKISVHLVKGVQLAREKAMQGVWRGS